MKRLEEKIAELKVKRNAVILAHNYVAGEVQDVADFVGDSLELSIKAQNAGAPVIVFCGVSFMAETAKILSPASTVLHPDPSAGCPMADMVTDEAVRAYRRTHPDTVIVAYVNTTAAVKAEVDICCTSGNAERIIRSIPKDKHILFLPDQNLGANISRMTGREMELWPGYCPTHHQIQPEAALRIREQYPDAVMLVHPECMPAVVALADEALSTGGMLGYVQKSDAKSFIIGTECGILHRLRKENPEKTFISLEPVPTCPDMKKISLERIVDSLTFMQYEVVLDAELMDRARLPIEQMLAV